jgi:hypothetical protein
MRGRAVRPQRQVEESGVRDLPPWRLARRRAWWGLGILLGIWVGFDAMIGILVRSHEINERCTGYSVGAGGITWIFVLPVWFGVSWRVRLVAHDGHGFIVGRTLTGPRAVDLDRLVAVRRFQSLSRYGPIWDELRLKDSRGVRLSVDPVGTVKMAVRQAIETRELRVSNAVKNKLGMKPGRFAAGARAARDARHRLLTCRLRGREPARHQPDRWNAL